MGDLYAGVIIGLTGTALMDVWVIFMLLVGKEWLSELTLLPVWLYSISTILVGWFLLHPGLGLGMALAKTENPFKGRCMGLMTHSVFGLGMWFGAFAI